MSNKTSFKNYPVLSFDVFKVLTRTAYKPLSAKKLKKLRAKADKHQSQYTKQFNLEVLTHPLNLDKTVESYMSSKRKVKFMIKHVVKKIYKMDIPEEGELGADAIELEPKQMGKILVKAVLTIDKPFIDMGEMSSRIASQLTNDTGHDLLIDAELNLSLRVLACHFVSILAITDLIEIRHFPASDTSEGWTMITPKVFLPKNIRTSLLLSGKNMPPSLVPMRAITENNGKPWITDISYNVFNGVQNIDNDVKALHWSSSMHCRLCLSMLIRITLRVLVCLNLSTYLRSMLLRTSRVRRLEY